MKKKKVFVGIGVVLVAIVFISFHYLKEGQGEGGIVVVPEDAEHVEVDAKIDEYCSLKEIEEKVDIIVKVVKDSEEPPIIWRDEIGNVYFVGTIGNVKVTQVYTNKSDQSISVGDIIPVFENEAYDSKTNMVYHVANYTKMISGREYMLFLTYSQSDNWYVPCSAIWGKYPLDASETVLYSDNMQRYKTRTADTENNIIDEIEQEVLNKYN